MPIENKVKLQFLDPNKLLPYKNNAKVHEAIQIEKLAQMIKQFGFDQPIVVDKKMIIIKGHARREAALLLKLKMVPVIVADHLDEKAITAARIGDNKISETSWDYSLLKIDMKFLDSVKFDASMTGFNLSEIGAMIENSNGQGKDVSFTAKEGSKEYGKEKFEDFEHTCPKCGFEFD